MRDIVRRALRDLARNEIRAVAQLGRAPASGAGGRGFKSHQPDKKSITTSHVLLNEIAAKAFFQWKLQPGGATQAPVPCEFYAHGFFCDRPLTKITEETMRVKFTRNWRLRSSAWLEFPLRSRRRHSFNGNSNQAELRRRQFRVNFTRMVSSVIFVKGRSARP